MLKEYFIKIKNKEKCYNCSFYNEDLPIIEIPAPKNTLIVLISRDSTQSFIPLYELTNKYESEEKRLMLFANAIPNSLIVRIKRLFGDEIDKEAFLKFCKILFDQTYWTHYNKCPTRIRKKFSNYCAQNWLEEEINKAISNGAKIIVTLGSDVEKWLNQTKLKVKVEHVINLPHPSGLSRKWNKNNEEFKKIKKDITEFIDLLNNFP